MANRLAAASSPYLLQHKDNPVDWHEWGEAAFAEARERDVPVLLSVGYSACHWCHVMAHESFEDAATAAYMNEHFVNVKVDREERPDVDRIYMDAVQAMTGRGGWPMTVFLDTEGRPFFAGTYFPKEPRGHHPTFRRVMEAIVEAWTSRRAEVADQASRLTEAIRRTLPPGDTSVIDGTAIQRAVAQLVADVDWTHGGFGSSPKFPQAPNLELLLRALALGKAGDAPVAEALGVTLDHMAAGGIYDHLGGGFARYSVDERWLVPHFEKMLYDNALLARVYLRAGQLLRRPDYLDVAVETLDYVLRDLRHPEGGLYSAEDADSEGVEGKFYVWSRDEFSAVVGADAPVMTRLYGVTEDGNFEGANILHLPAGLNDVAASLGLDLDELRAIKARADAALLAHRNTRPRPGLDDKVITAWNGLALRALAEAGAVLDRADYIDAARGIARFARHHLTREDGRLLRSWREGVATVPGFCEDYGAMAVGLFTLYEATGEAIWFEEGRRLTSSMIDLFADSNGGFYATGTDAEELIARPKNVMDNPTPSDNSLAAEALQKLAAYTGDATIKSVFHDTVAAAAWLVERYPAAAGHLLAVVASDPPLEVAIFGEAPQRRDLERVVWETFRPNTVLAPGSAPDVPLLEGRESSGGALAYVCRNFVCDLPVADPGRLRSQLDRIGTS